MDGGVVVGGVVVGDGVVGGVVVVAVVVVVVAGVVFTKVTCFNVVVASTAREFLFFVEWIVEGTNLRVIVIVRFSKRIILPQNTTT